MKLIGAGLVHAGGALLRDHAVLVGDDGRIAKVGPTAEFVESAGIDRVHRFTRCALLPGCVNSHVHSFQVLLRGRADHASGFRSWVDDHLYPLVLTLTEKQVYAATLLACWENLLAGVTAIGEFYYIHTALGSCEPAGNRYSEAAIRAARDLGMRVCLLRTLYDRSIKEGQRRFCEPRQIALASLEALRAAYAGAPDVQVLPAPHSLHGASGETVQAAAELAGRWGVPFHIHLAEQQDDVHVARRAYGTTPLRALEGLGVLSERTVVVHGCWLDEEERRMLGEARGGLAYNPLTNMYLGDGVTDVPDLLERGVTLSLGTDANLKSSIFDEMRAAEYLQRIHRLEMATLDPEALLAAGTAGGARNLGLECGEIAAGRFADLVVVDLDDPSLFPVGPRALDGDDPRALLSAFIHSMVPQRAVLHGFVAGEPVLWYGDPVKLSRQDLADTLRDAFGIDGAARLARG